MLAHRATVLQLYAKEVRRHSYAEETFFKRSYEIKEIKVLETQNNYPAVVIGYSHSSAAQKGKVKNQAAFGLH